MRASTHESYRQRLLAVLLYIERHLDEDLPLEELAREAHFSPYHFHRIFRGMLGESVKGYVRRLRLERAAMRLAHTSQAVTRIALEAGYETHESFSRAFKVLFGVSPQGYREACRAHGAGFMTLERFAPQPPSGGNIMEVRIERLPAQAVAFMRHVGPYAACGQTWQRLCAWAGPKGLLGARTLFLGVCHDDPEVTAPENIRYDACISLERALTPEGEVGVRDILGGEYAVARHKGPLENLKDSYAWLCGHWAPRSGREIKAAPSVEIYRNDPDSTPPEEILVDICVPLES
jgi:AraC family transcriptional regulator